MQTQLALAYAMTVHKSQGLTMPKIYPSLQGIFGFGMPYTLMTRTRLAEDMIFVGVPPSDIYPLLKETSCQDEMYWNSALQSMIKVNEDFKIRYNDVVPKQRREHQWRSLQQLLQGDQNVRLRIQYYKQIATKWMTDSGVNVLARCTEDKPLLPTRLKDSQIPLRSPIQGYLVEDQMVKRPTFPEPQLGFVWNEARTQKKRKSTSDPLGEAHAGESIFVSDTTKAPENDARPQKSTRSKKKKRRVLNIAPDGKNIKLEKFVKVHRNLKRQAAEEDAKPP